MPSPSRKDVACWLKEIWDEFPTEIVKNPSTGKGCFFENPVDYSGDTESESEVKS